MDDWIVKYAVRRLVRLNPLMVANLNTLAQPVLLITARCFTTVVTSVI